MSPTVDDGACNWFYWGGDEGRGSVVGVDTETPEFQEDEVLDLSAGSRHTFIIDKAGKAYSSGFIESFYSYQGHLGLDRGMLVEGPNDFMAVTTVINKGGSQVPSPRFSKVYAGAGAPGDSRDMHALLIDERGNVYTTGNNDNGQLCLGDHQSRDIFSQVTLPGPAVAAGVGLDFTLILLADGRTYGCGSNENGELGLGPNVKYTAVPKPNGLSNIIDISAGLNYGLYLQDGGKVLGSGSNLFSQLCESTDGDPVDVPKVRRQ